MMTEEKYNAMQAKDREWFKDAPLIYQNEFMNLYDCSKVLPKMKRPWAWRNPFDARALVAHHPGAWNAYWNMYHNVLLPRYRKAPTRKRDGFAYGAGIQHNAEIHQGRVTVWLFNPLNRTTAASGSPGQDSKRFVDWRRKQGPGDGANSFTFAVNLQGYFASAFHPYNHPLQVTDEAQRRGLASRLIDKPSRVQLLGLVGIWKWLEQAQDGRTIPLFGHVDTGKAACPGDLVMDFMAKAQIIAGGKCPTREQLVRSRVFRDLGLPEGYPQPAGSFASPILPSIEDYQRLLVELDLNALPKWGVDGKWGDESRLALIDFEEEHGLLANGFPDLTDYEELRRAVNRLERHRV